jgi:Ser/Thr protein kinase RdoA (MazF antagonist)
VVTLAEPIPVSGDVVVAILERRGLPRSTPVRPLPATGIINTVYAVGGDLILRVPRANPQFSAALRKEARLIPAARSAGVRTPALLAFDDRLDVLPVPYAIYERVHGATLGLLDAEPHDAAHAWRELGRDLALLHAGVGADALPMPQEPGSPGPDPCSLLEQRASEGWFTTTEARWLAAWLTRLAPPSLRFHARHPVRVLHADTQPTNVMVDAQTLAYRALIDWGDARWGDVAGDFVGPPLRAVPHMLAGHRDVAPLDDDDTVEARILWRQLRVTLALLPRGAAAGLSWGERPVARLLEIARFFLEVPDARWAPLAPPTRPAFMGAAR